MPRIVDHDARRRRVAEEAAELIAERGIDAVTFRELGERAGCSTAIVSHYFRDKRDVLRCTYAAAADRARQRFSVALAPGAEGLQRGVEALLPLQPDSVRDWRVWFAFWGHAITDPELAAEQRAQVRRTRAELARVMRELIDAGDVAADLDADEEARRLLVVIMGIAAQAAFDQADWPAERQQEFVRGHLDGLASGADASWALPAGRAPHRRPAHVTRRPRPGRAADLA